METFGEFIGFSLICWFLWVFLIRHFFNGGWSEEEKRGMFVIWILPGLVALLFILFF